MDEQLFSAKPKPVRLRRKSLLGSNIKASVSAKLSEFLGDYNDDVLLEYITVLICNGKDQYEARDDLEAFLGKRSGEFVSWLWNLLSEYTDKAPVISPDKSDGENGARVDRCSDLRILADKILMKGDCTSNSAGDPTPCNDDTRLSKSSQHCPSFSGRASEVNTRTVLSQSSINQVEQVVNQNCSRLPRLVPLPREAVSEKNEYSISGRLAPKLICAGSNLETSLPTTSRGAGSLYSGRKRGSVWDRLGKPCDDTFVGEKRADSYCVGPKKLYDKFQSRLALIPPNNSEFPVLDERSYSYPVKVEKLDHGGSAISETHISNNIGRKRLFGEISTICGTGSALVDESNMYPEGKVNSQNIKKSKMTKNNLKTTQNQELLEVKQKLNQIVKEMSKLRSKQMGLEKSDGKPNHLLNPGVLKESEEPLETRTVFVTNVHFAATREALSLHFSKCGMVVNVMILTDVVTFKPKGSAYVTFASKECVDKALALSGTTFFCRILKVLRMAEAGAVASAPTQLMGKTSLNIPHGNKNALPSKPPYIRSNLQWRRESSTAPSEHSDPSGVGVPSASGEQHLSSSDKDEKNSSLVPPAATAST